MTAHFPRALYHSSVSFQSLYHYDVKTVDCVRDIFEVKMEYNRVRQLHHFLSANNVLYNKVSVANPQFGINWQKKRYTDLDFADKCRKMWNMTDLWKAVSSKIWLRKSSEKTKIQKTGNSEGDNIIQTLRKMITSLTLET